MRIVPFPSRNGCLTRNLTVSIGRQRLRASLSANFASQLAIGDGGRVLPLFLWRRLAVLDLAARDIYNELSSLAEIAGR